MATETLNLNDTIADEQDDPRKALNPTDIPITMPDHPKITSNPQKSSTDGAGAEGDTSKNKNGATAGVSVGSLAGDNEPVSHVQKKIRRAERFGLPVQLSEEEKRNTRAERFGTVPVAHGSDGSKKSEEAKRKARAERFGLNVPSEASGEGTKKKARLEKFATLSKTDAPNSIEADKRKARAIRFSNPPSGSLSQVNGEGVIELKAAVIGKAGGGA